MEFFELLESITGYIPVEYSNITSAINMMLPWLLLTASVVTCFAGHKIHRIWTAFIFFCIFFIAGCMLNLLFPAASIYIFIAIGFVLGTLAAVFSHHLLRLQLFVFNSVMVYILLSGFLLKFLPDYVSIPVSILAGIIAGVMAMRYKYLIIIITTSVTGAAMTVLSLFNIIQYENLFVMIISVATLSILGITSQYFIERKEIKESLHHPSKKTNNH